MSTWLRFVLGALATWRVTHLLAYEDGPLDVFVRLRRVLGNQFFGKLMDCFACLTFWVAVPITFWVCAAPLDRLLTWIALSGAAGLLERLGQEPVVFESATQLNQEAKNYGMLQSTTEPTPPGASAEAGTSPTASPSGAPE